MTNGEVLAIIRLLASCKKDVSFRNLKKVARSIDIKVLEEEREPIEEMIQVHFDIIKEDNEYEQE